MKKYFYFRLAFFTILGIIVFIFNKKINDYVALVVGGTMLLYGMERIVFGLIGVLQKHTSVHEQIFFGALEILLGFVMIIMLNQTNSLETACVVWAVWSILREGKELEEIFFKIKEKRPFVINLAESLVTIVLSVIMLSDPLEHVHAHVILLGIELISKVWFEFFDKAYDKYLEKKLKTP